MRFETEYADRVFSFFYKEMRWSTIAQSRITGTRVNAFPTLEIPNNESFHACTRNNSNYQHLDCCITLHHLGAVVALVMAFVFSRGVMAQSEGEPEMIEIAEHVRAGAMAYLKRQYKVVFVVFRSS